MSSEWYVAYIPPKAVNKMLVFNLTEYASILFNKMQGRVYDLVTTWTLLHVPTD